MLLTTYRRMCHRGLLRRRAARRQTEELLARFHVAAPGPHTLARQLSGGNLQKLILARELSKEPRLIVADQPTDGLDIGATVSASLFAWAVSCFCWQAPTPSPRTP